MGVCVSVSVCVSACVSICVPSCLGVCVRTCLRACQRACERVCGCVLMCEHARTCVPQKTFKCVYFFAEVKDVVHAVMFLLSDQSDMINGASLFVDGGVTAV